MSGQISHRRSSGPWIEDHVSHGGVGIGPGDIGHTISGRLIHVHQGPRIKSDAKIGIALKIIGKTNGRGRGLTRSFPAQVNVITSDSGHKVGGRIQLFSDLFHAEAIDIKVELISFAVAMKTEVNRGISGERNIYFCHLIGGVRNIVIDPELLSKSS
ncbi:hypothetical protein DSECCO2_459730 [anaerobic digester metagenome]